MLLSKYRCAVMAVLLLMALVARAQTPEDILRAIDQNNRIQQENNERLRREQQERQSQVVPGAKANVEVPAVPPVTTPADSSAPCQNVKMIVLQGVTQLSEHAQQKLVAPFIGRCMSLADINALLAVITNAYVAKGLVTARAYIAPQDMSGGTLEVLVVEGVVEKIILQDGQKNRSVSLATAFPGLEGEALDLHDLEQGLDQINKLPSNNATLDIQPSNRLGASTVVIYNQPHRMWSLGANADNYGSSSTGTSQLGVNAGLYNLASLNDIINLNHSSSFPYAKTGIGQTADTASMSLSYGYYTFSLSYNGSSYQSQINGAAGIFETTGTSKQTTWRLDRVVYRGAAGRAALSASLITKESRNYILGELIVASSRDLTVLDLAGNYITGFLGGGLTLELGFSQGLKAFDALDDAVNLPDFVPRAQFQKINYGMTWIRPFSAWKQNFSFSTQWQGQYGLDALYGSEQISVGSFYSVRGFRETSLAGDRGFYARNDLSLSLPVQGKISGVLRPFIGCDVGNVAQRYGNPGGTLAGFAAGASMSVGRASFDLTSTRPLYVPNALHRDQNYTFLRASYSL